MDEKSYFLSPTKIAALLAVMLFIGVGIGLAMVRFWNKPLAKPLPTIMPTATMGSITTPQAKITPTAQSQQNTPVASPTPKPSATPTEALHPMCGGPAKGLNILVLGTNHGFYDLADVIRVVHVDFVKGEVYVVPLPRDLKINLPPNATKYKSPQKLNEGYFLGTPAWQFGANEGSGAALMAQTLAYNFGISVDNYVVVSGEGFRKLVDALGGVQVYLPTRVKDEHQAHADFPPGYQTLDGYHAWLLARIRSDVGDLGRIDRQTLIVKALLRRITNPNILPKLPQLAKIYKSLVLTDLSPKQINELICLLQKMDNPKEHIHFYSVPRGLLHETGQIIYIGPNKSTVPQDVLLWDERYKKWLHDALQGKVQK